MREGTIVELSNSDVAARHRDEHGIRWMSLNRLERLRKAEASSRQDVPLEQYAALLCEAIRDYDFPAVTYDFTEEKPLHHDSMLAVEQYIGTLLSSKDVSAVKDGLSNVLYCSAGWGGRVAPGAAQRPGRIAWEFSTKRLLILEFSIGEKKTRRFRPPRLSVKRDGFPPRLSVKRDGLVQVVLIKYHRLPELRVRRTRPTWTRPLRARAPDGRRARRLEARPPRPHPRPPELTPCRARRLSGV